MKYNLFGITTEKWIAILLIAITIALTVIFCLPNGSLVVFAIKVFAEGLFFSSFFMFFILWMNLSQSWSTDEYYDYVVYGSPVRRGRKPL